MDSEDKQRISLYLDKETVIKMDEAIKKYDYRSRNDFVSFAVDNLIADKLLDENDTVISEKLSKAIAEMSEAQTLQIAKSMFRYCRLSQEDERLGESLSIENQRLMLQRYAEEHRFPNIQFYVDDGFSGADFNRPAFKRMMYEVECGRVGIVIVKDQSRLGRDYLQTGMLMEITFPQYDVRFIAVNDGVDSANGVSDFSGIKNYFNDFYARDTSRKIRAVQRAKGERGERVGTTIPYGYMKK